MKKEIEASEIRSNILKGKNITQDNCIVFDNNIINEDFDFTNLTSNHSLKFKECIFKGKIKAIYSTFKEVVEFEDCIFEQKVNFSDCEQAHTVFEKAVNIKKCTFKGEFCFVGVIVKGIADFDGSIFEKKVNFICAKFERALFLCNAKFHSEAIFKSMKITSYVRIDRTQFLGKQSKIDFTGSMLGDKVTFKEIVCESILTLIAVKANFFNFEKAKLYNTLEVRYINCKEFICEKVEFRGKVDFDSTRIQLTLNLRNSEIYNDFSLKSVVVHQVNFKLKIKTDGRLDLRGFKFEVMPDSGSKEDLDRLLTIFNTKQIKGKFGRDPYIELERFYRSRGRTKYADKVHYEGRCQLRKYAFTKGSNINMGRGEKCLDWIVKTLTGYGVNNLRVLSILLGVIVLGTISFCYADVAPKAPDKGESLTINKAIYYTAYATDMFIPLVSLGLDEKENFSSTIEKCECYTLSEKRCLGIELFRSFYILLGWLLVPLATVSITGFLTKTEK